MINDYYLDLNKVNELEDINKREVIHNYYKDMLYAHHDGREKMSESILRTLVKSGFLLSNRDVLLSEILDKDGDKN